MFACSSPCPMREMGHRVFGRIPVPIRSGINRGRKWSVVALGRGYRSGSFGREGVGPDRDVDTERLADLRLFRGP
jgi:hypothetical protein